ncbi:hypothetical protein Vadar_031349 [Vaccinium darrowii]|uniref:Uncharacterized protein n=1 Tax=Vaccinium darrowii TaxID=229202 RepID=A0ACB7XUP7_9ERIC|nr:hypothetical protein Vadar_031349 [Vaccinium darrowii]
MSSFLKFNLSPRGRRPNDTEKYYQTFSLATVDADFKPFMKTIILVATLIATVTFAAAFTMPGGFDTRPKKEGVATLVTKAALKVFILSDTFAMCCSITVVLLLSMAMLAERDIVSSIAQYSMTLLYLAFFATLVAFMSGVFAVIAPKALWVAISVCIVCSAAPFLISPCTLPGFPYITLLHPAILYRLLQGLKQKLKHWNKRKSEQRDVRLLIQRGTPDPTYRVSNTNTVAN